MVHTGKGWKTEYPFLYPRELLRAGYESGLRVLHGTERSLKKNGWGDKYNACIEDMLERQVVKKISKEEMNEFLSSGETVIIFLIYQRLTPKVALPQYV